PPPSVFTERDTMTAEQPSDREAFAKART
ncbi:hypothetical protein HMPREF1484_00163, partial [Dermabacter sp. HFH0086]